MLPRARAGEEFNRLSLDTNGIESGLSFSITGTETQKELRRKTPAEAQFTKTQRGPEGEVASRALKRVALDD